MIELADYQLGIENQWFGVSPPVNVPNAGTREVLVGCSRSDAVALEGMSGQPAMLVRALGGAGAHRVRVEAVDVVQNTLRLRLEDEGVAH